MVAISSQPQCVKASAQATLLYNGLKIKLLKLLSHLPVANELTDK